MYFITSVELCLHLANTVGSKGAAKGRKYSFYLAFMLLLSMESMAAKGSWGGKAPIFFLFFFTSTFGIGQRRKETHLNSITGFVLCRGGGHMTPDTEKNNKTKKQQQKKTSPPPPTLIYCLFGFRPAGTDLLFGIASIFFSPSAKIHIK